MAPLTPSFEVSTELVFCETETLQLGLHQMASLQKSFPIVQASLLRQGQAARQSAATPERRCPPIRSWRLLDCLALQQLGSGKCDPGADAPKAAGGDDH